MYKMYKSLGYVILLFFMINLCSLLAKDIPGKKQTRHRAAILALAIAAAVQSRQRLDDMSPEFQELCRMAMY